MVDSVPKAGARISVYPHVQPFLPQFLQIKEELSPYLTGGVYPNFLDGEEARQRTMQAYTPDILQRLQVLKMKYDPQNVFRFSFDLIGLDR